MLPAGKYVSNHTLQTRDVDVLLKRFRPLLKCKSKQKVMDIGCGPGDVTNDYLLPLIRPSAELHGIDKSEKMVEVAKSNHTDSRLNFQTMDLIGPELVPMYETYFDSVYSFYCLHWVHDQRKAMENIYSILKPEGEVLLIFSLDIPTYILYETLSEDLKWAPYLKDYNNFFSPLGESDDAASEVKNLMEEVGFHIDECSPSLKFFTFASKQLFYGWASALDLLRKNIPEDLLEEYDEEREKIWKKENLYTLHDTNEVTTCYRLTLVAKSTKFFLHCLVKQIPAHDDKYRIVISRSLIPRK